MDLDQKLNNSLGVRTTILSATAPGACIEKDATKAAALARSCNEYAAEVRDTNAPGAYGFFASLPSVLDTEEALAELAYALDVLHADGVILFTRYGPDNCYLGNAKCEPIWAELSRRKAVVLVHPTHPVDKNWVNGSLPQPMFDYPHETGRSAIDLVVSGMMSRHPGCKIILSHAGGTLPYLIYRAAGMLPHTPMKTGQSTEEIVETAREFYFDTAISANPVTLRALFAFAKPGHVLFGSDFPNAPGEAIAKFTDRLERYTDAMGEKDRKAVEYNSALELFPRLKSTF